MQEYKTFTISGSAVPETATGFTWNASGSVLRIAPTGITVELNRVEDREIFENKQEAEARALELCKEWIDAQGIHDIRELIPWVLL